MKAEIAIKAADLAIQSIVIKEQGGDNRGEQIAKYLKSVDIDFPAAWCQAFCHFLYEKAAGFLGEELSEGFKNLNGYTPDNVAYAKKHNLWIPVQDAEDDHTLVKKGYMAYFYSPTKKRIFHVEMVISTNEDQVITVGGNTSPGNGVIANGDGVYKRTRTWKSFGEFGGFFKTY